MNPFDWPRNSIGRIPGSLSRCRFRMKFAPFSLLLLLFCVAINFAGNSLKRAVEEGDVVRVQELLSNAKHDDPNGDHSLTTLLLRIYFWHP